MNYNILGYFFFLVVMCYIIGVVGLLCYKNGIVYCNSLLPNQESSIKKINEVLLIGYYLITIVYCFVTLVSWEPMKTMEDFLAITASKIANLMLILAFLHYLNIFSIQKFLSKLI